jgi:hypothetical protein
MHKSIERASADIISSCHGIKGSLLRRTVPSEDQPFQADHVWVMNSKVLVDGVGSSGGGVGVQDLSSVRALVAVEARDGVLDLVDDRLVVSGGSGTSSAGVVGHARGLVVDGLAGGLVLIGLEVSVMDVRNVVMVREDERQTWQRGRRCQWRAPW